MNTNLSTTQEQSARLLRCGVSADTADMHIDDYGELWASPYKDNQRKGEKDFTPVWSLSALLGLLPFKIHSGKYEYWLDIAPMDYGKQWSIRLLLYGETKSNQGAYAYGQPYRVRRARV